MRCLLILLFLFFGSIQFLYAQKVTVGVENGINFSNLHGDIKSGKWDFETGSVNGIYSQFEIGNWLALQTGIGYNSYFYNKNSRSYYFPDYYRYNISSHYITAPSDPSSYFYSSSSWNFNFLKIPFLMKFKTPGKLSFAIGGGPFYSLLLNDEYTGKDRELYEKNGEIIPENHDWGWMLNSSLSYSFNNNMEIRLSAQTSKGRKTFVEEYRGKNGSTDFTLGIGYNFGNSKKEGLTQNTQYDTSRTGIEILPFSGLVISRTVNPQFREKYKSSTGSTVGILIKKELDKTVSIITGAWYERKGYHLEKYGNTDFLYVPSEDEITSKFINADTDIDYLTFPFLFDLRFGNELTFHVNFGAYYSFLQNVLVRGSITQTNTYDYSYSVEKTYIDTKQTGWFKDNDIGGLAGFRLEYSLFSNSNIFLGAYYSKGFKNVLDYDPSENQSFGEKQEIVNSSYSVLFGFSFSTFNIHAQ